jgi:isoamylase
LALTFGSAQGRFLRHLMINAHWEPLTFQLPPIPDGARGGWRRRLDTALPSPDDISSQAGEAVVERATYVAQPRSVVLLGLSLRESADGA